MRGNVRNTTLLQRGVMHAGDGDHDGDDGDDDDTADNRVLGNH